MCGSFRISLSFASFLSLVCVCVCVGSTPSSAAPVPLHVIFGMACACPSRVVWNGTLTGVLCHECYGRHGVVPDSSTDRSENYISLRSAEATPQ